MNLKSNCKGKTKMDIIGLSNRESGCGYHRIMLPIGYMDNVNGYVSNFITEDKEQPTDIVNFNRLVYFQSDFQGLRDKLGCKIVMDIDDHWQLPANHLNYKDYKSSADQIQANISAADLVTVTNAALLNKVLPLNANAVILPNALPYDQDQFQFVKSPSDKVRVMWCGSITHEPDLNILRQPFKRVKQIKGIELVMGGYNNVDKESESIWKRMATAFSADRLLPSALPFDYMQMYNHADIVVIPLEQSDWHACKSNLKILEAASRRVPVICSNVAPYNLDADAPVLWVNKQSDWFNYINLLKNNPHLRENLGNQLYEWAKEKYNFEQINDQRRFAFENICKA